MAKDKSDKKKVCISIQKSIFKEFNKVVAEKYGQVYGFMSKSIEDSINLWMELQKGEISIVR